MTLLGPYALALVAGLVSVTSPCCLPLMPGYLSYVSGVAGKAEGGSAVQTRVLVSAALFVLGFSIVFTLLGASASSLGSLLLRNGVLLTRVAGIFVIIMGFVSLGLLRIPILFRELRVDMRKVRPGPRGALPLGMAFAFGWTPCIGPVLGGILTAAATTRSLTRGASLLFVYSLGLGIPFMGLALGYTRAGSAFAWLRRHGRAIERTGGVILVGMGVLMISGYWVRLFVPLIRIFSRSGWPPI